MKSQVQAAAEIQRHGDLLMVPGLDTASLDPMTRLLIVILHYYGNNQEGEGVHQAVEDLLKDTSPELLAMGHHVTREMEFMELAGCGSRRQPVCQGGAA